MTVAHFISLFGVAVSVTAAISDVRDRRIPNRLTYPAALVGMLLQTVTHGWRGLLLSLGGALLFGGVFLLFHIARAMGAGDVKLAGAMGCIAGLPGSLQLMVATVFAGGALAFIYMVVSGREMQTLRNTFNVIAFHARHGVRAHPLLNLENPGALRMPYALAFATGTLYWALMMHSWR